MKILFYFFKNVHIPLFEPIISKLASHNVEIYFASPEHNPQIREGLSSLEKQGLKQGTWLNHSNEIVADVALMADCVADRLQQHKCIVNIGHGLISKGQYYSNSPLIGRENLADILCVPGPWHKETLEKYIHIPVVATGMSKLDALFTHFDKTEFSTSRGIDPHKKIILWAPTFNMELSSIPVIWTQIRKLCPLGQVLIKLHGTTDIFFKQALEQLASRTDGLFYITEADTTPYMKASDLMITDVSSVMFEYTALDKPIVLVDNPHQEEYVNYNLEDVEYFWRDIGVRISKIEDLLPSVSRELNNPATYKSQRERCAKAMFAGQDGKNSDRIAEVILNHQEIAAKEPPYQVVLNPEIPLEQLNYCVGQLNPKCMWLHKQYQNVAINAPFPIKYFSKLQDIELGEGVANLYFHRPAQLLGRWQKSLLGVLGKLENSIDILGALSTSPNYENAKVISQLKVDRFKIPEPITPQNLAEFVRITNVGEYSECQLESAVVACNIEGFEKYITQGLKQGFVAKDVLAMEPS